MTQLLQNAAYGTALILAAALLRQTLKNRLLPGARLLLWAVCLFRLLTPVPLESALSLWGLFQPQQAPAPTPAPVPTSQLYIPALTSPAPAPQPTPAISWETVLLAAWLLVGAALAVRYVLSWRSTRRAVNCAIPVEGDDPRYAPLPKCARLREGPMEGAPLTFGAVKPTVVLTPGLEGETLDCVLAHEGIHAQRRDNLWHYAMALALVVHWWNPAVWLMARLLRRDIELSCDRAAVNKLGAERRADYANALLSLSTQAGSPAFCQTFGRKAAEERILSVMKFKKASIIGVVLSLALVLAVTAAFASEPKEPDNTVQFHGQTYSRDQLSQETLDWLDWYFALPEDEQLAISYVPAELRNNQTPETQDAYGSEKVASDITSVPYEVLAYVQDLSIGMSREDVHKVLGEPSFSMSSPTFFDCYELDPNTPEPQLGIYYDVDGTVAQVRYFSDGTDPDDTGTDLAHYLSDTGEAEPGYVLDGKTSDTVGVYYMTLDEYKVLLGGLVADGKMTQEDADWLYAGAEKDLARYGDGTSGIIMTNESGGYAIMPADEDHPSYVLEGGTAGISEYMLDDYVVKLPTFDEDGNPVAADGGITGNKFYDYEFVTDSTAISGGQVRTASGTHALCDRTDCGSAGAHYHDENGNTVVVFYADPAAAPIGGANSSTGIDVAKPAPTQSRWPVNSKGQTYGTIPHLNPGSLIQEGDYPDLIAVSASADTGGKEGYILHSFTHPSYPGTVNNPDEARKYMDWLDTQPDVLVEPLYNSEGDVIGEYRTSNPVKGGSNNSNLVGTPEDQSLTQIQDQIMTGSSSTGASASTSNDLPQYPVRINCYPETHHSENHHSDGHH